MARGKTICNICGKEFDIFDEQESFGIHTGTIGYGSQYDGDKIDLDMCCDCFDGIMEDIILKCTIDPVTEN